MEAVEAAGLTLDDIESVGIGTPGTANSETGIIEYSNNLGFLNLSKANKSSNLVEELHHKVDKLKADLKEIREKIKILDANS